MIYLALFVPKAIEEDAVLQIQMLLLASKGKS